MRVGTRLVSVFLATSAAVTAPGLAQAQTPAPPITARPTPSRRHWKRRRPPAVALSPDHRTLAILGRENLPSIANLSKPILRLGGYRIDPATNGQAEVRVAWLNALSFQDVASGRTVAVKLPQGTRFAAPDWSPDGAHLAFYVQEPNGLSLWVADRDGSARAIAKG